MFNPFKNFFTGSQKEINTTPHKLEVSPNKINTTPQRLEVVPKDIFGKWTEKRDLISNIKSNERFDKLKPMSRSQKYSLKPHKYNTMYDLRRLSPQEIINLHPNNIGFYILHSKKSLSENSFENFKRGSPVSQLDALIELLRMKELNGECLTHEQLNIRRLFLDELGIITQDQKRKKQTRRNLQEMISSNKTRKNTKGGQNKKLKKKLKKTKTKK